MNSITPVRRVAPRCLSYRPKAISSFSTSRNRCKDDKPHSVDSNPILDRYRQEQEAASNVLETKQEQQQRIAQELFKPGDLAPASIFEDEVEVTQPVKKETTGSGRSLNLDAEKMLKDPDPRSRERWLRKKVIQSVQKGGRMSKDEMIARTEREHLVRSYNMKTSVKKLGALARQIAGKTVEEALVQMQFSKKGVAEEVHAHLLHARNEATVARGMGLGLGPDDQPVEAAGVELIRLKDGKKHRVADQTKMYVEQAWVGRGPYGKLPDFRARGRTNIMRTPWTSLTVVLKEEKTRMREHKERVLKAKTKREKNVYQHLPDRTISGYRGQYYSW